jgi:NAD(P)H-dependent flavin oxidoreductase YrpB (nitropropane dioxygenase family)
MGTRFLASEEAFVHPEHKRRVVQSRAEDTIYREIFDLNYVGHPHRVLRNTVVREREAAGRPPSGRRPGEGSKIGTQPWRGAGVVDVLKYAPAMVTPGFKGDLDQVPMWAGESCSLVKDVKPAAQSVRQLVR